MRLRVVCVLALVGLLGGMAAVASAASPVQTNVLVNDGDRIVVQYDIGAARTTPVEIDGKSYIQLKLESEPVSLELGAPALPYVCRSLIIPDDAAMAVRVVDAEHYELAADVAPSKGNLYRCVNPDDVPHTFGEVYKQDAFYPGPLAELGAPYIMRDHRGLVLRVNPFRYNPASGMLRVYTRLTVEVYADGPGQINVFERPAERQPLVRSFQDIYRTHFLNFDALRYDPIVEEGDMLIICHDPWIDNMTAFADHKTAAGINASIVGVSTIGNNHTAIKNYIQGVYDQGNLAFVLLVGDIDQIDSPTSYWGASDPSYAKLAGGDDYPEIMVGRFSANTAAEVDTQVQRTIDYENLPAVETEWFWRGTGIASAEGSGYGDEGQSDSEHMAEIRTWLLDAGYTYVDEIYDPGANESEVTVAVNDGRGVINYTGHGWYAGWSTTGFDISAVNNLVNDNMLPFITSVACNTGEFENYTTCFGEAWLRATSGGTPTGGIGCYASSISQSWAPPMEGQDEFNLLLTNPDEPYHTYGALCFAGSCSMMDDYGEDGVEMFDTWIIFGDPSLRVIGTIGPPHGLKVTPGQGLSAEGQAGGPFTPDTIVYTLTNYDAWPIDFQVTHTEDWVTVDNASGSIPVGGTATVTVSINDLANVLGNGYYSDTVSFANLINGDGDTTRTVSLKVGVPTLQYEYLLDSDPGWATQGQWAFGQPTGQGGTEHGHPDPTSGYTGDNVFGVNLNGDYSTTPGGPYWVTLGPVDLSEVVDTSVRFQRWLNSDYQPFVYAMVQVSADGSTWTTLWENGGSEIAENAWSAHEFDISGVADDAATVYVRWGYEVDNYSWAYSGWNLDDIEIWGLANEAPEITILDSDPPDGAIDARKPHDADDAGVTYGWTSLTLTFSGDCSALTPADFDVSEIGGDGLVPMVSTVTPVDTTTATITLSGRIQPLAWTVITHVASGSSVQLGYLPADANQDGYSSSFDVLDLINHLNGEADLPEPYATDIDRSGETNSFDVLETINLLNGAGLFDEYNEAALP